jgi:DNA-binding NarL/FixJ family response regulator
MSAFSFSEGVRVLLVSPESQPHPDLDRYFDTHDHVQLVGRAPSEHRALQLFFSLKPDLTLLDPALCETEPARFLALLKRVAPDARVIFLSKGDENGGPKAAHLLGAEAIMAESALPAWLDAFSRKYF